MAGFANEYRCAVAEFGPDPRERHGRGLMAELWTRVQGFRTHPYGAAKSDPSITWNGAAAAPPQAFAGFTAAGAGGGAVYRDGGSATIASGLVEGPMGDPARRIFAQRLARRQSLGGV